MKSLSGILGALCFLMLLAMAGSAVFPQASVHWTTLALPMILFAILSVATLRLAKASDDSNTSNREQERK